jgi:tetratricopeptide (TPR) repeat protein
LGVAAYFFLRPRKEEPRLPQPGSKEYLDYLSIFTVGTTALDVENRDLAKTRLTEATQLIPEEPAAWANLGLLLLRMGDLEGATQNLDKAHALAPQSGEIEVLRGMLESRRGRYAEAIAHLRRAVELNPRDLRAQYALVKAVEQEGGADSAAEVKRLLDEILKIQPDNLAVLLERLRLAAKEGDGATVRLVVARLGKLTGGWPANAVKEFHALEEAAAAPNPRPAATQAQILRNVLAPTPAFREALDAVQSSPDKLGEPLERFLVLAAPSPTPSPPDEQLSFTLEPLATAGPVAGIQDARWDVALAVPLTGEGKPAVFVANGHEVRRADAAGAVLPFPGGPRATPPTAAGVLALDWDHDFKLGLVLAGAGGMRLFRQGDNATFTDVTKATTLGTEVTSADCFGAWAADVEMDGDLDIILGVRDGPPLVLRNNRDGTFKAIRPFPGVSGLRGFVWADLDRDGAPDAALLDAQGKLHVFSNERAGHFRARPVPDSLGKLVAITAADVDRDGALDLVVLRTDGAILRVSDRNEGHDWEVTEIARWPDFPGAAADGSFRLFVADLDNNGGLDLVAAGPSDARIWLSDEQGKFQLLAAPIDSRVFSVADLAGNGRLDLVGVSAAGQAVRAVNRGTKSYHWQVIRPHAQQIPGDGRINTFGVGGEMELRAGLLYQKQVITGPSVHFGLGDHPRTDVVRIVWPNGTVQAEFELEADQAVQSEQRLKGSCPFIFTYDGTGMQFVTDFIWRSPLGLRINAQDTAGGMQTEDWVKIRGDQLVPRDGYYDVRITAELWETHFFDHIALLVVDHPAETEVFVDERFARTPPELAVRTTTPPRPVTRAWDDRGHDVTDKVRARDGRYLDTFGRGRFQGVTRDHWVEVELGDEVPRGGPLWLIANGWIHPTDSSLNVAIGQGQHDPPRGLSLEVPDGKGGWVVARPDLGFPAGKNKTILIRVDDVFRPGTSRRLRLRTNLEIYWDQLAWAKGLDGARLTQQRLAPASADLVYRGFSLITRADSSSPELPHYDRIVGTTQCWRDLIGYHTRFGDVRELLARVDDRYVIMNAGDELRLRFPAPAPPPTGWVRDFVLIGDGWEKDGDYNTAFSKTVLPLPSHDQPRYDTPPGKLEDDPVYRRHPRDWQEYHTRYVTPREFLRGLKPVAAADR